MATINDMGIAGVGGTLLQPKHKDRWRMTFANIGGGIDSQPLSMQVVTTTRPAGSFQEVEVDRYNSRSYIPGKQIWEPMNIVIEDDITSGASKVIQEQIQKQKLIIGAGGAWLATAAEGSIYKFVTYLDMLDGNEAVLEKWTIEGCFIAAFDYTDLDYSDAEKVHINITLRFDNARQSFPGYKGLGVATGGVGRI
jgi:hypothetical protein